MRVIAGVITVVSVNLVLVLSACLLFLHSFKGPFNKYLIYFTFIKSVAINKDLSQPLRAEGVTISETRDHRSNPKQPYCLKISLYVNVPLSF